MMVAIDKGRNMTIEGDFFDREYNPNRQHDQYLKPQGKSIPRVLIIDDDDLVRTLLFDFLNTRGYEVTVASSGIEGLEKLKHSLFDIVITDLKMPEMDGLTLTKKIKEMKREIEIIVVTGYGTTDAEVEAMQSGVSGFLRKPFRLEDILGMLEKVQAKRKGS
jgi:DNA-binding NtrC family response regulator